MKYFIGTEFIEGKQDKTFLGIKYGETKPTIDLISIGIVAEEILYTVNPRKIGMCDWTGKQILKNSIPKEYYAISKDFNLKAAWNNEWVRENVLFTIYNDIVDLGNKIKDEHFTFNNLKQIINKYGKTNKEIAKEAFDFVRGDTGYLKQESDDYFQYKNGSKYNKYTEVEFYGYYSDYDWVVFCQLFGTMMDLPKGFPMYCKDLKQVKNEAAITKYAHLRDNIDEKPRGMQSQEFLLERKLKIMENCNNYPKQTNKHNALSHAKWNYELYKFLNTL